MKRKYLLYLIVCMFLMLWTACNKVTEPEEEKSTTTTSPADTTENSGDHEDAEDYTWNESEVIPITLNGTSIIANNSGVTTNGSIATISTAGTYSLSGTLTNGQVIVDSDDDAIVRLILNDASITCSSSAPIYIKNSDKTIIVLDDNTTNTITDGNTYTLENAAVDEPNAAIYSKSDLTFYGNGTLKVTGNYNDAIASIDGLIIKSGTINAFAADDGIRGKDYIVIKNGNISISARGDGLKSDNAEDAARGYVSIENGNLTIVSTSDGITGETDVAIYGGTLNITSGGGSNRTISETESAKALRGTVSLNIYGGNIIVNSADDALHSNSYVKINGGIINASSADDGIHAEAAVYINGGETNIIKSVEGVEGPLIYMNDGNLNITSTDDGFNATKGGGGEKNDGSYLYLQGGNVSVNSSRGDGLDSNGNIVMTGGVVACHGPGSQPEVGTDYNGTFNISGGLLVLTGPNSGNMIEATSTSSEQYSVKATTSSQTVSASTIFHVQDESGNDIVTFAPVRNYYYIVFSSPSLSKDATYHIYTGGSSTGKNSNGLYTGGVYSGGTLKKTFTISSKVTNVTF